MSQIDLQIQVLSTAIRDHTNKKNWKVITKELLVNGWLDVQTNQDVVKGVVQPKILLFIRDDYCELVHYQQVPKEIQKYIENS